MKSRDNHVILCVLYVTWDNRYSQSIFLVQSAMVTRSNTVLAPLLSLPIRRMNAYCNSK